MVAPKGSWFARAEKWTPAFAGVTLSRFGIEGAIHFRKNQSGFSHFQSGFSPIQNWRERFAVLTYLAVAGYPCCGFPNFEFSRAYVLARSHR